MSASLVAPAAAPTAGAALLPAAVLAAATAALATARAAYMAAPHEECSPAGPWWTALEAARAAHLTAWFAHRATTRPAALPRLSLVGTTPLGLLVYAAQCSK